MIYYFCGHRGCGKNFLANQIVKDINIGIIDTGPIIREAYNRYNSDEKTFKDWMIENEKKYGADFSNMLICKLVDLKSCNDYIVIGYRSMNGIEYFNNYFGLNKVKIIYIDGDYELFRKNYNQREKKSISKEEYDEIVEVEDSMGIKGIKDYVLSHKDKNEYFYKNKNNDILYEHVIKNIKENSKKTEMER